MLTTAAENCYPNVSQHDNHVLHENYLTLLWIDKVDMFGLLMLKMCGLCSQRKNNSVLCSHV